MPNIQPKHLYIHIPFCKKICSYCDFVRFCGIKNENISIYIDKIIDEIKDRKWEKKFSSIYIGGGTPNFLNDSLLEKLLLFLSGFSNDETEFTIECNPEFITKTQCEILKKNGVNRISLGIQSTNDEIVKKYNRSHNMEIVNAAIEMLCDYGKINNISCDFIYGFSEQTFSDLKNDITFVTKNDKIKHVSFYSLELKENSILTKNKYHLDEEKIDDMFSFLLEELKKSEFIRYEISSFAKDEKYFSKHNIAYWKTDDWAAFGIGAFGMEDRIYYNFVGNANKWEKKEEKMDNKRYYFQILMMGLRLINGIDLKEKKNKNAYDFFKDKIKGVMIKDDFLVCIDPNKLDETLIDLF